MPNTGLNVAGLMLRLLGVLLLAIYYFWTRPVYPDNTVWTAVAIVLLAIGLLRKYHEALITTFATVLLYGSYKIFKFYLLGTEAIQAVVLNDLLWLVIFPFMALLGAARFGGQSVMPDAHHNLLLYQQMQEEEEALVLEPESSDFLNVTAFQYKLEEEVLRGLRERRKFKLLLVEIHRFREYKHIFGIDAAKLLLQQVTEMMQDAAGVKAFLGDGLFAVILSEHDRTVDQWKEALDEQFYHMLLTRPRKEGQLKMKLQYGVAECPTDGIEAKTLMEAAQQQMQWNGDS